VPESVDIMWTGPAICSRHLTQAHMQQVADVLRRPALIWDNYPVNDAAMIAQLHIGPYRNRDADLPVRGIYANPMSLVAASRLPLLTFADYCANPAGYDPDRSWAAAVVAEVGEELAGALVLFAEAVTISPLTPEQPPAMVALVAPFQANLLPYIHNPAPDHLRSGLAEMRAAHQTLMRGLGSVPLLAEMEPWLRDYGRWIDLMDAALRYVDARYADDETERAATMALARAEIRRGLKEAVDLRTSTCGDVLRCFLQELLRRTGEPLVPEG
jgi:hyaluronoglucosaminidase